LQPVDAIKAQQSYTIIVTCPDPTHKGMDLGSGDSSMNPLPFRL